MKLVRNNINRGFILEGLEASLSGSTEANYRQQEIWRDLSFKSYWEIRFSY